MGWILRMKRGKRFLYADTGASTDARTSYSETLKMRSEAAHISSSAIPVYAQTTYGLSNQKGR